MVKNLLVSGDCLTLSGATKIVSSSPSQALVETDEGGVLITGSDIEVKSLDLQEGRAEFCGKFSMIKFGISTGKKPSLLKRIFK